MNSYQGATKIHKYLMTRWADTIRDRDGDAPRLFNVTKWEELGIGGGDGAGIVWEGFYAWTRPSEIDKMKKILAGTGLHVYPTTEWMVEIY